MQDVLCVLVFVIGHVDPLDWVLRFPRPRKRHHGLSTGRHLRSPKYSKVHTPSFITTLNTSAVLTRVYSQVHPDDDGVLSVITYAVGPLGVAFLPLKLSFIPPLSRPYPPSHSHNTLAETIVRFNTVLVVGHTNCGGAAATLRTAIDGAPCPGSLSCAGWNRSPRWPARSISWTSLNQKG
jgi:hypothetical protein